MTAMETSIPCHHRFVNGRCEICGYAPSNVEVRLERARARLRNFQERKPVDMGRLAAAMKKETP